MRLAIIGTGRMGSAIVSGLLDSRFVAPHFMTGCSLDDSHRATFLALGSGLKWAESGKEAAQGADLALIAVKPPQVAKLLASMDLSPPQMVVSVAAGIPLETLQEAVPTGVRVCRVMPNTPVMVREGAVALSFGPGWSDGDRTLVHKMFEPLGRVWEVKESQMDAVTALSGSGPAYFYRFVELLTRASVERGLDEEQALEMALQTALGAAVMLQKSGKPPAELIDQVVSPGGTTEAALKAFEAGGLPGLVDAAVDAAAKRSGELAKG